MNFKLQALQIPTITEKSVSLFYLDVVSLDFFNRWSSTNNTISSSSNDWQSN